MDISKVQYLGVPKAATVSSNTVLLQKIEPQENFQMIRKLNMTMGGMWRGKLRALITVALILATAVVLFPGCRGDIYTQTIEISVEPVDGSGLLVRIEYYCDSELANSVRFVDGDGDNIIDGKSGPVGQGQWPKGWEWFDDMYRDVIIGQSTIAVVGEKIIIQDSSTYEFLPGNYECGQAR